MKAFPIDFIRQVIEQTLEEQHLQNPNKYFGGKDQVNLFSFYEQLQKEDEVDRYTEIYKDLVNQQNRTGLIMNGTIIAPENPTITNLYDCDIIPMNFTCSFRVKLADRDRAIETINHLISVLKGKKQDLCENTESGVLFKLGTVGNTFATTGNPVVANGDYVGYHSDSSQTLDAFIKSKLADYLSKGIISSAQYLYYRDYDDGALQCAELIDTTWTKITDYTGKLVIKPPYIDENNFDSRTLSMSFDSIRCDEPRTLNSDEFCVISFGGSATLCSYGVVVGNNMTAVGIKKIKICAKNDITISDDIHWLEPLEIPSGNNADTRLNQLISNNFVNNSHTDSLSISTQYTFIVNKQDSLIYQFFKYGRYGIQADGSTITYANGITPNMIYEISEIWCSFGEVELFKYKAKIVESIDIENTESDTLTITIPFQVQGENN